MARSKTPSGQKPGAAQTVYKRPYWFDRARSLCELHGWPRSDSRDGRGLVGRYTAAADKPIGKLDERELEMLFTQGTDPHYLVPVALDQLRDGSDAKPTLLRCVLRISAAFWQSHPYLASELVVLVAGRLADADEGLACEAGAFVERHRAR